MLCWQLYVVLLAMCSYLIFRASAKGSLAGNPQLVSGTANTLTVNGFTPDAVGVLRAGVSFRLRLDAATSHCRT